MKKIKLNIAGMHCTSCAKMIEMELEEKVKKVSASFDKKQVEVEFDENKITERDIKDIITKIGYKVN